MFNFIYTFSVRRRGSNIGLNLLIILFLNFSAYSQGSHSTSTNIIYSEKLKTVYIEELTWPELNAKINKGFTTVIVPTGGTEQGGPYLALGKHNFIIKKTGQQIAFNVGHVLVAPLIAYVPEGEFAQPSGNLLYPGTLGVSNETFSKVLIDISVSLYLSGFKCIAFLGDHSQSIEIQSLVAKSLNEQWKSIGVRVINLDSYNDVTLEDSVLIKAKIDPKDWGQHAGIADTSELIAVRPNAVRRQLLNQKSLSGFKDGGASGRAELSTSSMGSKMLELRQAAAAEQLKSFLLETSH